MRQVIIAGLATAALALSACSRAEQDQAKNETQDAAADIAASVKGAVNEVASDEDIAKAKAEVDEAAEKAGEAVKAAGAEAKDAAASAAKDAARDAKAAVHEATAPTPEEKAAEAKKP